ncbi:hypothetical protein AC249_AIPGENE213 [Exaiptasia diaphana]|nr:hypothetical protein AC249_AIPGENE213 [Exaiptasia diaphana]
MYKEAKHFHCETPKHFTVDSKPVFPEDLNLRSNENTGFTKLEPIFKEQFIKVLKIAPEITGKTENAIDNG